MPTDGGYITEKIGAGGARALGALLIFPLRAPEYNVVVICLQLSAASEKRVENGGQTVLCTICQIGLYPEKSNIGKVNVTTHSLQYA